jgi:uncharacterized membrane protein SpoIIM required for sporulation
MRLLAPADRTTAVTVAAVMTSAAAVAAVLGLAAGEQVRHALGFDFAGAPRTLTEAASIFAHNTRFLFGIFGLTLLAQTPWMDGSDRPAPRWQHAIVLLGDLILAAQVLINAGVIGASVGAYGTRMLSVLLPHGPLEVAAFSLALTLYLAARRGPVQPRRALTLAALSVATLAVAAVLETYLTF